MEKIQDVLKKIKPLKIELALVKEEYKKTNASIDKFSKEINLINSKRERLWCDLKKLYNFFEELGNISEIKYSDFKKESSILSEDSLEISMKATNIERIEHQLNDLKIHGFGDYTKMFFWEGLNGARKAYENNVNIEKKLENYLKEIKIIEIDLKKYKGNLDLKRDYIILCEKITIEYRNLINEISDFLEEKIFPELEIIKLFLLAHSIKNEVIFGKLDKETKIIPTKVANLSESIYRKHYLFIQNTFLLFQIVQNFFSQDVITNLISLTDNNLEEEKINNMTKVEIKIKCIREQKEKVSEDIIYGGN
ncbi:MAG: hypothetical protein ACRCXT_16700 [Paraclostridium sp.]